MTTRILTGDCRSILSTLPDESIDCVVTSPPYFGLRDYGTAAWEGGDPACDHTGSDRYYTEKTAAVSSSDAFIEAGEANAARLKKGRWREGGVCTKCGAKHIDSQIGLEASPQAYVAEMVAIFREVRRVLKKTGTLWLNLGDSYSGSGKGQTADGAADRKNGKTWGMKLDALRPGSGRADGIVDERGQRNRNGLGPVSGLKQKDLVGIPWRVAFALQDDGWYLRQDIIWHKLNPMPESVTDRCTKAHEYLFLLSKSARYHYDGAAIAEKSTTRPQKWNTDKHAYCDANVTGLGIHRGLVAAKRESLGSTRNKRSVWSLVSRPFPGAHFATFPPKLVELCLKAGCPEKVCSECGKPWQRETVRITKTGSWSDHSNDLGAGMSQPMPNKLMGSRYYAEYVAPQTLGFKPSCACGAIAIPATVLDPFGGAGTTSLVADRMGLHSVMIELNPDYAEMARWRLIDEAGMFAEFLAAE